MSKKIKTTLVKENEIEVWDDESESFILNQPGKYFITLATGDLLFIHTRDRLAAQQFVDEIYSPGFYRVRQCTNGNHSPSGNYTCTGTQTRRGQNR